MVSRAVLRLVSWWASPAVLQGIPLGLLKTEMTLFTDASTQGWEQIEPAAPVRQLDQRTMQSTYQRPLDGSRVNSIASSTLQSTTLTQLYDVQQLHSSILHQERGGHQVIQVDQIIYLVAPVLRSTRHNASSGPSTRSQECNGGRSVSGATDITDRVVNQRAASPASLLDLGIAGNRQLRHVLQQETASLRVTVSVVQ